MLAPIRQGVVLWTQIGFKSQKFKIARQSDDLSQNLIRVKQKLWNSRWNSKRTCY